MIEHKKRSGKDLDLRRKK